MLMCQQKNFDHVDPRAMKNNDPVHGVSGLQNSAGSNIEVQKRAAYGFGPRSGLAIPKNYVPLPDQRQYLKNSLAYMNGAGRPLFLEWCGTVEHTRLQPTQFSNEQQAQEWRQKEWLRQKGRRRFSNKRILEEEIQKRFATNESAQANYTQRQFKHPNSERRFYAFLRGMTAAFGSLE